MRNKKKKGTAVKWIIQALIPACLLLGSLSLAAAQEEAPKAPAAPCSDAEYRQMDFWVGFWDLTWTAPDGTVSTGKNSITKMPYGDCVITERFDGGDTIPLDGMSVSMYSKPHKVWRQTWVDNQGGYFALTGGPQKDGRFILMMDRLDKKAPLSRMVFEDIEENSLVWRWQSKAPDAPEDSPWRDLWVINYERVE